MRRWKLRRQSCEPRRASVSLAQSSSGTSGTLVLREIVRRHADGDDAARLDDVQPLRLGSGHQFVAFAARIEPQLVAAAGGNLRQNFQSDRRRQIDADPVELQAAGMSASDGYAGSPSITSPLGFTGYTW